MFPLAPSQSAAHPQQGTQADGEQQQGHAGQTVKLDAQEGASIGSGSGKESSGASKQAGAVDSRRMLRQGAGQLSGIAAADTTPYCQEGAAALQVAPPPGSAVFFW